LNLTSYPPYTLNLQEERFGDAMGELGLECMKLSKLEEEEAAGPSNNLSPSYRMPYKSRNKG
jgi:hypothetical protein